MASHFFVTEGSCFIQLAYFYITEKIHSGPLRLKKKCSANIKKKGTLICSNDMSLAPGPHDYQCISICVSVSIWMTYLHYYESFQFLPFIMCSRYPVSTEIGLNQIKRLIEGEIIACYSRGET